MEATHQRTRTRTDRTATFHLTRQRLLSSPTNVAAWLEMSTLVDDPQQQRECLERVLALDPHNEVARDGIERLRLKLMLAALPSRLQVAPAPMPQKLGDSLLARGLISQAQLDAALAEQRRRKALGERIPLGEIMLAAGWLTPEALAHVLAHQLPQQQQGIYLRLGEYLVAEGRITRGDLEAVLSEQLALKQSGECVRLGDLLLRRGLIAPADLYRLLEQQHTEFMSCFGD